MILPDYNGGSIVNLMTSITSALGSGSPIYPALHALPPSRLAQAQTVVLLVIDGLGYKYLCDQGAGSELHGHLAGRITSTFPPTTATAIPAFFTGLAALQHGFTGWFTWFRELGSVLAVLPFRPRCGGELGAGDDITPLTLSGHEPIVNRLPVATHVVSPARIARSTFNRAFSGRADIRPYDTLGEFCNAIRMLVGERASRQYIHAYWPQFDSLSHEHGVGSSEVASHFDELDQAIRILTRDLSGSGTVLVVTADHGFIDTRRETVLQLSDYPQLVESLAMPLSGEPRFAYCYVHPDRREQFESCVLSELADYAVLHRRQELLDKPCFGIGEANPRFADRIGDYALEMKQNYAIKDWIAGEKPYRYVGVHGGTSAAEIYVPLILIDS
jgi:predicted AlkP superfamily pyrophosphatase or phosphodiesterase